MICPNCNIGIRFESSGTSSVYPIEGKQKNYGFDVAHGFCPECHHLIVCIRTGTYFDHDFDTREMMNHALEIIHPLPSGSRPIEPEVPAPFSADFDEACRVLPVSAKASAAMSRRILQHILRDQLGIKKHALDKEIEAFIQRPGVPSQLAGAVDAIRTIGNFAAHPQKNLNSGEIIDVEPGEAEWLIDVLESLFDFVFVQPARLEARKEALNAKLQLAGKPTLK